MFHIKEYNNSKQKTSHWILHQLSSTVQRNVNFIFGIAYVIIDTYFLQGWHLRIKFHFEQGLRKGSHLRKQSIVHQRILFLILERETELSINK